MNSNQKVSRLRMKLLTPDWLYILSFLDTFATSLIIPLLTIHFRSLGMSHMLIGIISSVYAGVQLFSSPAIGCWSDKFGKQQTLKISLLICAVSYLILGVTTSIFVIVVIRFILGIMKHTQTICKTLVPELFTSEQQTEAFGMINAVTAIGFVAGPAVGGYFIETENGFQLLCTISCLIFVFNTVIVYYFLRTVEQVYNIKKESVLSNLKELFSIEWKLYWDVLILKLLLSLSMSLFYSNYALTIEENFDVSPKIIGYTNSFQSFVSAVSCLLSTKFLKIYYTNKSYYLKLFHSFFILSLSFLCLGFVPNITIFVLCLVPLCTSSSLLRIMTTEVLLERAMPDQRGSLLGSENTIASIAYLIGPSLSGFCRDQFGPICVSILSVLLTGIGATLSAILNSHPINTKGIIFP
uniref:Major facilitator superfamily (MFS) profile domain-containing protein n=1 Tax=Clastoptera arizonana TaxID=38151 RepID=A0A1B6DTI1_9HEMI